MKKFLFSTLVSAVALTGLNAVATPPPTIFGPITFNWTLTTAKLVESPKYSAPGKVTITGSGFGKTTNILQVYTSSDTTTPNFGNASFLALLANSLGQTFPAGSKLVTDATGGIFVVDSTGKNVVVDSATVATILTVNSQNGISSGVRTVTTAIKFSSTNSTSVQSRSQNAFTTLNYDDSAKQTTDGTQTKFQFVGISVSSTKSTQTVTTNEVIKGSETFTLHGFGTGTIRGQNHLIQGTVVGTPAGTETLAIP